MVPDTKNHEPHTLPLSDFLFDLLTSRRTQAAPGDRYVFASDTNRAGHLGDIQRQLNRVTARSGITFTLHDLRRTFMTTAEGLDISAYAVKRLANHKTSGDVTAGYVITDVERLRKPMQAVADFLLRAIGLRPRGEVVTLPRSTQEQAG
ncbi:tyrosine-type recombinase/integrase [Thiobaca trueperi]|uniref:Phage integrase family protein n=1 Tax=Thiobaca trueperi TaxID=127458 RepID=A0A4R3MW80_9GAMM|nr:tyrosine-type recombinase/integrase [Thiobaca trueperi]TCT18993.1 phage integrase family protein [Thiobaca trueperi]